MTTLWVHLINVATHAPGIYYLFQFGPDSHTDLGFLGLCASIACSCIMHASETKHGLSGVRRLGAHSTLFLNTDRFAAVLLACIVALHSCVWEAPLFWLGSFVYLSLFTLFGELTHNSPKYVICHTIWHIGVFTMAGRLLSNAHRQFGPSLHSQRWMWSSRV